MVAKWLHWGGWLGQASVLGRPGRLLGRPGSRPRPRGKSGHSPRERRGWDGQWPIFFIFFSYFFHIIFIFFSYFGVPGGQQRRGVLRHLTWAIHAQIERYPSPADCYISLFWGAKHQEIHCKYWCFYKILWRVTKHRKYWCSSTVHDSPKKQRNMLKLRPKCDKFIVNTDVSWRVTKYRKYWCSSTVHDTP